MPDYNQGRRVRLETYAHNSVADADKPLHLLAFAVFGVLLIGCVNLAGLLLARGVRRQRELSLRAALGAPRARILRQLLTEAALLALTAVCGILLAAALLPAYAPVAYQLARAWRGGPSQPHRARRRRRTRAHHRPGRRHSSRPALRALHSRLSPALGLRRRRHLARAKPAARLAHHHPGRYRARPCCSPPACCYKISARCSPSISASRPTISLTEELFVNAAAYQDRPIAAAVYQPLIEHLRALPGVSAAGLINIVPIASSGSNGDLPVIGQPPLPHDEEPLAELRFVTPGAIEALGAHHRRGPRP